MSRRSCCLTQPEEAVDLDRLEFSVDVRDRLSDLALDASEGERIARATARIALSPTVWPSVSLIGFKLSMSITATLPEVTTSLPTSGLRRRE